MKIYILTTNPFPIGMAATNRIVCYAKGLIDNGIDCKVVVVNRTERIDIRQHNFKANGIFEGVHYTYISNTVLRNQSFIKRRFEDLFDFWATLYFCLTQIKKDDIVLSYHSRIMLFIPLLLMFKFKGVKIVRELCEYPQGTVNDSLYHKILCMFELKILFPLFSGFIAISQELERLAKQHCHENAKIIKVPILVEALTSQEKYIHPRPYIFHCGTMYERKDAIISTMKAFAIASKELNYSIDFLLAGPKSPHWTELKCIIDDNSLNDNIIFLGQLPHNEIVKYQNGASLAVLNKNDNIQNRCGFSTKLGEVLLSKTPVITTTIGEANYYLKNGISAYIVEPHNPDLIAQKIIQAFLNEEERLKIAAEGERVARSCFDYKYQGKRLIDFWNSLSC